MRLYNVSSCTPSTIRPARQPSPLRHYLPPKAVMSPTTPRHRSYQRKSIPGVSKSATSTTTESSSATTPSIPVHSSSPLRCAELTAAFSVSSPKSACREPPESASSSPYLFDLDVVKSTEKNDEVDVEIGEMYSKDSSSTVSTHTSFHYLLEPSDPADASRCEVKAETVSEALTNERDIDAPSHVPNDEREGLTPKCEPPDVKTWTTPTFEKVAKNDAESFTNVLLASESVSSGNEWLDFQSEAFQPIDHPAVPPQTASVVVSPVALVSATLEKDTDLVEPNGSPNRPPRRSLESCSFKPSKKTHVDEHQTGAIETSDLSKSGSGEVLGKEREINTDDEELLDRIRSDPSCDLYQKMIDDDGVSITFVRSEMKKDGVLHSEFDWKPENESEPRIGWDLRNVHQDLASVWTIIDEAESDWLRSVSVDSYEIQTLFGSTEPNGCNSCNIGLRVIEPNRANKCDRVLSGIKLTPREIAAAIDNIDHNALTLEQMKGLLKFIPTEAEATALKGHAELTKIPFSVECEHYMSEVMHVLGVETKMKAMIYMKRFPICANYFVEDCRSLRNACEAIIESKSLRRVLSLILHLGKMINAMGGGLQPAASFRLSSILKVDVANDGKTSFLDYVAKKLLSSKRSIKLPSSMPVASWVQSETDFSELDAQLPEIRSLALKLWSNEADSALSIDLEATALGETTVGQFVLSAYRTTALVYAEIDETRRTMEGMCRHFGESEEVAMEFLKDMNEFLFQLEDSMERVTAAKKLLLHDSPERREVPSSSVSI